jgi:CubicO group peptidase (beta-lactamase class C family)
MARLAEAMLGGSAPGLASMNPIDGIASDHPNRTIGMLWDIVSPPGTNSTIVGHNGRTGGYSALLVLLPQAQRAVIVLVNVSHGPQELQRVAFGLLRDGL